MDMRKILRLKRGQSDAIIEGLLRGKQMTRKELVACARDERIPPSTAYKRIKKFLKSGHFELVEYIKIAEEFE